MAGPNVIYESGKFAWTYTPPSPNPYPATELRLKWGTDGVTFPNVKPFAPTTVGADVHDVLPAGSAGQFHAHVLGWVRS